MFSREAALKMKDLLIFLLGLSLRVENSFAEDESLQSSRNSLANLVIILADDLGFNDVSFHGSPQIPTPNLDALAFSGIILNKYYVSPICTPSRSSLFTGKHPIHLGMQHDVIFGSEPFGLSLEEKILPEYLKDKGFKTHLVGKWHLGHFKMEYTPTHRGFDSHFGHWTGHKDYYDNMALETKLQLPSWGYDMRRDGQVTYEGWGNYTTDLYTAEANKIIRSHPKNDPLFLVVSHTAVHSANWYEPLQAPEQDIERFSYIENENRRKYAAMLAKLDESVGSIMTTLKQERLIDNTIIVFSTDNGGPAEGFNLNAASNWPLRGVKNTLWEGGVRGAGFIWSSMLQNVPRVSEQMIHIQDWVPTLLHGVGLDASDLAAKDGLGIDLWTALNTRTNVSPRSSLLHNIDEEFGNEAIRVGNWKLMKGTTYNGSWDGWYGPSGRNINENLKRLEMQESNLIKGSLYDLMLASEAGQVVQDLSMFPDTITYRKAADEAAVRCEQREMSFCDLVLGEYCLFNIQVDPCEYNNVADKYPLIVDKLRIMLEEYRNSSVPPRNQPHDPMSNPRYWNYTWTNWKDFMDE